MNQKQTLTYAAISGGLTVAIGAFGAHGLKSMLTTAGRLETFELAVRYQFYHTFALLAVGILMRNFTSKKLNYAAIFFLAGIIFFSGSLYVLCFTGLGILGVVTPIGGVFFILGWVFLVLGVGDSK
jgi:uncharacterized membrane protein YgdD (TMEM256/DUF423 family)